MGKVTEVFFSSGFLLVGSKSVPGRARVADVDTS